MCIQPSAVPQVSLYACGNVLWTCSRVHYYDHVLMEALLTHTGAIAGAHAGSSSSSKGEGATASSMEASVAGSLTGSRMADSAGMHCLAAGVVSAPAAAGATSASNAPIPVAPHTANGLDADSTFMLTAVLAFYCCAVLNHRSQAQLTRLSHSVFVVLERSPRSVSLQAICGMLWSLTVLEMHVAAPELVQRLLDLADAGLHAQLSVPQMESLVQLMSCKPEAALEALSDCSVQLPEHLRASAMQLWQVVRELEAGKASVTVPPLLPAIGLFEQCRYILDRREELRKQDSGDLCKQREVYDAVLQLLQDEVYCSLVQDMHYEALVPQLLQNVDVLIKLKDGTQLCLEVDGPLHWMSNQPWRKNGSTALRDRVLTRHFGAVRVASVPVAVWATLPREAAQRQAYLIKKLRLDELLKQQQQTSDTGRECPAPGTVSMVLLGTTTVEANGGSTSGDCTMVLGGAAAATSGGRDASSGVTRQGAQKNNGKGVAGSIAAGKLAGATTHTRHRAPLPKGLPNNRSKSQPGHKQQGSKNKKQSQCAAGSLPQTLPARAVRVDVSKAKAKANVKTSGVAARRRQRARKTAAAAAIAAGLGGEIMHTTAVTVTTLPCHAAVKGAKSKDVGGKQAASMQVQGKLSWLESEDDEHDMRVTKVPP